MEVENLKAFISEEEPSFKSGDDYILPWKKIKGKICNVYPKRLEDLTFGELEMMEYTNPNLFVKEWEESHGSFDENKIVWVVVYNG